MCRAVREQAYQAWRQDPAIQQELQRADAYTAAFFLPKQDATQDFVPVSQNLDELERGSLLSPAMASAVAKAAADFRFLHWHLAFPDAMKAGGFDCVLGNPPWERIKLQEKEFFAARSQEIASAPNKAARERLIQALSAEDATEADRILVREFEVSKREAEGSGEFIRGSGRFALTAVGDLNTYALFAEHFLNLISPDGRAGLIVPTGIATDNSTKAYFDAISGNGKLISLISFENESFIFKEVHHAYKFCVLMLRADASLNAPAQYCFYIRHFPQLSEADRFFSLTSDDITLLNPNTRTCPVFRSQMDAELSKKIYGRTPVLIDDAKGAMGNPWAISVHSRLFHMAEDSHLFFDRPTLERLPLYEAKLIHHYDHRWSTFGADGVSREVTLTEKQDLTFQVAPRYWVEQSTVKARLSAQGWDRQWMMGWRDITNTTNERTVIATVIPMSGLGHTLPALFLRAAGAVLAPFLGNWHSIVLDFCARNKIGGTHLTYSYIKQFPFLPPSAYSKDAIAFIQPRVLELTYTSHDLKPWAEDLGYDGPPFRFDPERRALLRAELDAFYAHLYGLSRDELRYILDPTDVMGPDYPSETFRVLKNNEIRQFGEYRTQRLVLEAWDQLFGGKP